MFCNHSFNTRWRDRTPKKLSANMYSGRKVGLISVFSAFVLNDYVEGDHFGEIVHQQSGKNPLGDVLHLFALKLPQANGIFQLAETGFNPPTETAENSV